jgi:hypothetical protein
MFEGLDHALRVPAGWIVSEVDTGGSVLVDEFYEVKEEVGGDLEAGGA